MTGPKWQVAPDLRELAGADMAGDIDKAVSQVALSKHGKKAIDLDYSRLLQRIGNLISRALSGKVFGYFEDTHRPRFSMNMFRGTFRNARGPSTTFIDVFEYEGAENFPSEFVFLFDVEKGRGLRLFPLIARGLDSGRSYHADADFFVYDIARRNDMEIAFRAVQEREEVVSNPTTEFPELFATLSGYLSEDPAIGLIEKIALKKRATDS
jgi:hypothetical protein